MNDLSGNNGWLTDEKVNYAKASRDDEDGFCESTRRA